MVQQVERHASIGHRLQGCAALQQAEAPMRECGDSNAFYNAEDGSVTLCYDMVAFVLATFDKHEGTQGPIAGEPTAGDTPAPASAPVPPSPASAPARARPSFEDRAVRSFKRMRAGHLDQLRRFGEAVDVQEPGNGYT